MALYESGTLPRAFGEEPQQGAHDGLKDTRSILQTLCALDRRLATTS